MIRLAVFASGGGTNLQALLDHFHEGRGAGACEVALAVSDRERTAALDRARRADVPARVVAVQGRETDDVARETLALLEDERIDLIALAGYLRLVPAAVVRRFRDRMLNIHPAPLPSFGGKGLYGLSVHRAVLDAGCRVTGATVHLVDERYDTGPILAQWPVPVLADDTPEMLAERVLRVEHRLYPTTVEAVARGLAQERATPEMFASPGPVAFRLAEADVPAETEVRRALGLE